jgi:hypothetical protein
MRPIKRYELVSLIIPANNAALRIPFPDIPQLRSDVTEDVIVRGLEVYSAESMPNDVNNNPVVTNAQLLKCFLTLYIQQEESVKSMPAVKLLNIYNAASAAAYFYTDELVQTENLMVDWTKSYVNLASSLANGAIVVFVLGVMYQRLPGGTMANLQKKANPANASQYQGDWYSSQQ